MDPLHIVIWGIPILSTLDFVLVGMSVSVLRSKGYFLRPVVLFTIVAKLAAALLLLNIGAFSATHYLVLEGLKLVSFLVALVAYIAKLMLAVWIIMLPPCVPPDEVKETSKSKAAAA